MTFRMRAFAAAVLAAVSGSSALARAASHPGENAPAKAQSVPAARNLESLLEALKVAPDDATARLIEARILLLWQQSPSDTATLLMARAKTAAEGRDYDLAIRLLNGVVTLRPDYVEGWNRRATVAFLKKDYALALSDIREVLTREPRHFGALSGLGQIMQDIGDDKRALDAYRRAVAINPRLPNLQERIRQLSEKVEGRDI